MQTAASTTSTTSATSATSTTTTTPTPPPATPAEAASAAACQRSRFRRLCRFIREIGPAGPMALVATCLPAIGGIIMFSVAAEVVPWLHHHPALGWIVFVVAFAVFGGFALVPTWANSIIGGWTYKFALGFPSVMLGLTGAAMIGYALAHRIAGDRVEKAIAEHRKWEIVKEALVGGSTMRTIWVIFLLRLSPLLPFETTNVLLATTGVKPLPFLIGTILGVMPRTAAIVLAAASAEKLDLHQTAGWKMLGIGLFLTVCGAVIITVIGKHALDRATRARVV
jgi:uncharacterized membrane protein YdjX (TVP38/TMEM64 family)